MRPAIIAITLAIGLLLAAGQAAGKEVAKVIVFPGSPVEFGIVNADNASLLDVTILTGKGSVRLLSIISDNNITWYKVAPLSPSKFFSYVPVLLSGDKIYVFGAQGTTFQRLGFLVGTLSLRELRGETTLIEPRTGGNETLYIIPIGIEPVKTQHGFHVLYLVANLVNTRSTGNATYEKEYVFKGVVFFRIGLEKLTINATLFPIKDVAILAQHVVGNTVYVAGISASNTSLLTSPPRNLTLVIGALRGNTFSLHYYHVPSCDMPIAMDIQDNVLYLECAKPEEFQLSLLAVNTETWRIKWAMMYNVSVMFVGKVQPPVVMGKKIYVPIMNGLLVVDSETGRPLEALSIASTPTSRAPRVVGVNIWRIGGEHYVVLMNVVGRTITLVPLRLVEKAKCIQVGSIALGETKIVPKPIKPFPQGTESIQGKQLSINTSEGPSLVLVKYTNVSVKEVGITYPKKCKPQRFPAPTMTITKTTTTITLTAINTASTRASTTLANIMNSSSTGQSATKTGSTSSYGTTSLVEQSTTTPGTKAAVSATASTQAAMSSSTKAINHRGWKGAAVVAAIIVLAIVAVVALLVRRK